jgi:hypothetical protein
LLQEDQAHGFNRFDFRTPGAEGDSGEVGGVGDAISDVVARKEPDDE